MDEMNGVSEKFELWALEHGLSIERDTSGYYRDDDTQTAWSAVEYCAAEIAKGVAKS